MLGAQRQLEIIANNLANVNTAGFKRDALIFGQTYEMALRANGGTGHELGTIALGAANDKPYTIFEVGQIQETGNPYDFAIGSSKGLFAIRTPQGVQYTRNGSFIVTADGQLITRDNFPVLDANLQPIQIPQGEMEVTDTGSISVGGNEVAKLGIFEGGFTKIGGGLFAGLNIKPLEQPELTWKSTETSNVNTVESMVDMIDIQRRFDLAQRSILQQDELTQKLIQSLNQ